MTARSRPRPLHYIAVSFALDDGRALAYRDIRRLGTVSLMSPARFAKFDAAWAPNRLTRRSPHASIGNSSGFRQAVKKLLMDQRRVAGVGNIYANEALWRAGIDPSRARAIGDSGARLRRCTQGSRACCASRSTRAARAFATIATRPARAAAFAERLAVYGRGGLPCPRCGATLIDTHAIDGRTTVFCARCQR